MLKTGNAAPKLLAYILELKQEDKDKHCEGEDARTAFWVCEYWYQWILRFRFDLQLANTINIEPNS